MIYKQSIPNISPIKKSQNTLVQQKAIDLVDSQNIPSDRNDSPQTQVVKDTSNVDNIRQLDGGKLLIPSEILTDLTSATDRSTLVKAIATIADFSSNLKETHRTVNYRT